MAKKNLGTVDSVTTMLSTDSILVEIGGSIRRITLDEFMTAIQTGSLQLRQYAWGVPLLQAEQSSPDWGRVGNLDLWDEYKSQIGRYLLTNEGKMAKLSKTDSTVFADGTALDESLGHVVVHAPRLYYLVQEDSVTGIPYLWGSMQPISGHYIEAPTLGAYKGRILSNALVSRSGYAPSMGNITSFWNAARVNGDDFGIISYDHIRWMMMLNLFEYGNTNSQTNIGYGICGSTARSIWDTAKTLLTGATASLGDSCGAIDIEVVNGDVEGVDCSHVSLFGIEDVWGWQMEMVMGIYFGSSDNDDQDGTEVFIYEGNRLPSSDELATIPSGDYRQLTRLTSGGYIVTETLGEYFDLIPTAVGGGTNSYWCDYFHNNSTGQLFLFGEYANIGAYCGLACARSLYAFSWSDTGGSRLAYYGTPTIVNGADIA